MYVIYLNASNNDYGYWSGNELHGEGICYPGNTGKEVNKLTKKYKFRKVAENAAKRALNKFPYVMGADVREIDEGWNVIL